MLFASQTSTTSSSLLTASYYVIWYRSDVTAVSAASMSNVSGESHEEPLVAMKKALRETQTLRAGCSKAEPKFLPRRRPPSRGRGTA